MSKIIIKNSEGMQTPFLRGILTSSLLDAGVEFNLAYDLSTRIRHLINDKREITTKELRELILAQLENDPDNHELRIQLVNQYIVAKQYEQALESLMTILSRDINFQEGEGRTPAGGLRRGYAHPLFGG